MKDVLVSQQFDDIYFSKHDGMAETAYVFLKGNNLPDNWQDKSAFTICETGFGTGLSFLSAWKMFDETAKEAQTLDFISIEKYPLTPDDIKQALSEWEGYFEGRIDELLNQYPIRIAGFHRIQLSKQVTLTLIFDDINDALPQIEAEVDCWFLDGFTPAKNPKMWSETLYKEMKRLSIAGATVATFTAASDVRRRLQAIGFDVHKKDGYKHKREMIAGVLKTSNSSKFSTTKPPLNKNKKIAIIGGGLAGTSCAYVLNKYGYDITLYEASDALANGASGNSVGLYNPRFSKVRDDLSDFFAPAYAQLIRTAKQAGAHAEYHACGALHLINDDKKIERYGAMAKNWMWHEDHIQMVDAEIASNIAGINIECDALYLPDSGSVNPRKLCQFYAKDINVIYNSDVKNLNDVEADIIILACGGEVKNFKELSWLELDVVRGQVTNFQETKITKNIKCNIHYGGYLSASQNGLHSAGSTFEKWVEHLDVIQRDHDTNIENLKRNVSALERENFVIEDGRAGYRAATNDRFPVIGAVPNHPNIYVSAAFGSHGIVSSIAGAHLIADMIRGGPLNLTNSTLYQLSPRRFVDRAAKRGRVLV